MIKCDFLKKKISGTGVFLYVFQNFYEDLFSRTYLNWCLSGMNQKNCIHSVYSWENTDDGVFFNVVADMWAYRFSKKWLHHRFDSKKIGKFNRTSILQKQCCTTASDFQRHFQCITSPISDKSVPSLHGDIILVLQCMRNNIRITLLYQYRTSIDVRIILLLYKYCYIRINIISPALCLHGHS